jgi:glycosyltransferase involved in cell wall biosynthesis
MDHKTRDKGISVIICCYNSATRLPDTLRALRKQIVGPTLQWEIIVVDNASDDGTADIARRLCQLPGRQTAIPFVICYEPVPGQGHARKNGVSVAAYSYLLFCDDDNWLSESYVQDAYNIMESDSSIAACGGLGIPVFEGEKPAWFDHYAEAYAVGAQSINTENGRILNLYGAGITVNRYAMDRLTQSGFQPMMVGRTGKKLSSSDDTELTYAFVLMGYRLVYAAELQFQHYLPTARLTHGYLERLFTSFGEDGPLRNLYYAHISQRFFHRLNRYWSFHLLLSITRLFKYVIIPPKKNSRRIYWKWSLAYIRQLFIIKKQYPAIIKNIGKAQGISSTPAPLPVHQFDISPI